jgi:hypothetical protein
MHEMQVCMSIHGLRPIPAGAPQAVANKGVTLQPGSGFLVLPCVGSQLQLYDCVHDCHVARIQVSRRNVSSFNNMREQRGTHPRPLNLCAESLNLLFWDIR